MRGLIRAIVIACQNRDRRNELEPLFEAAHHNSWVALVGAVRMVLSGVRDNTVLTGFDTRMRFSCKPFCAACRAPLHCLKRRQARTRLWRRQDLPPSFMRRRVGNLPAMQLLGEMGTQMLNAGGDMARLSAIQRRLMGNERDPDLLMQGHESVRQATGACASE